MEHKTVTSKSGVKVVVFKIDGKVRFLPASKFNPRVVDLRAPTFSGSIDAACKYIKEKL